MARIWTLYIVLVFVVGVVSAFTVVKDLEDEFEAEIRDKRDVLKGRNGRDLIRSKRYIGRVPVAYMKKGNTHPSYGDDELSAGQPVSHFREYNPNAATTPHRGNIPGDLDTRNLSDDEIQTLLLMLDGYDLNKKGGGGGHVRMNRQDTQQNYSPMNLDRLAQIYNIGKRETDQDKIEFLGDNARSKRTGARHLREADPAALSSLDRVFSDDNTTPARNMLGKAKTKKDIDWSNYLGIDKRNSKPGPIKDAVTVKSNPGPKVTEAIAQNNKLVSIPLTSTKGVKEDKQKEQERKENETVNKDEDRQWVLDEFYKNFAMMTNVKRKRESPSAPSNDDQQLQALEKQMTQVGDKIIWDALKYTGSHRDQELSPQELAKVKANIVDKLATAYSLEKVRKAVDELRQKISAFDNIPQA